MTDTVKSKPCPQFCDYMGWQEKREGSQESWGPERTDPTVLTRAPGCCPGMLGIRFLNLLLQSLYLQNCLRIKQENSRKCVIH